MLFELWSEFSGLIFILFTKKKVNQGSEEWKE